MDTLTSAAAPSRARFSFINILDPNDAGLPSQRKAVRSHAAFYQHSQEKKESASLPSRNKRAPKPKHVAREPRASAVPALAQDRSPNTNGRPPDKESGQVILRFTPSPNLPALGQGRVDPFRTYPIPWEPFLPQLVDHYLISMAVDLPELDEPEKPGLLRTRWFPLAMTEAATFQVIMLIAASHYASLMQTTKYASILLRQKSKAIALIRTALAAEVMSDQLIGAVAKMASYEAIFGDQPSFEKHMNGLVKMVELRGGLSALGLSGMLARMCVWIDCNSAFLNNSPLHFTEVPDEVSSQVNLSGFLAFNEKSNAVGKVLEL